MTALCHAILINAPPSACFAALTDPAKLAAWHQAKVAGHVEKGRSVSFEYRLGKVFYWDTTDLRPDEHLIQQPQETDRTITFRIKPVADGRIRLELTDAGWREDDPKKALCNTEWGAALTRLRALVEAQKE